MPDQDAELQALVVDMLKAGKSEDDVASVIQRYDDTQHPLKARVAGAFEGVESGLVGGLTALPALAKGVLEDSLSVLQRKSPKHAKAFLDMVTGFGPELMKAEPREQTKMIMEALTSFGMGALEGTVVGKFGKPAIRVAGEGLEYAGSHPFISNLGGAGMIGAGIWRGEPGMVAAGLSSAAWPPIQKRIGQKMIRFGGGVPTEELKTLRSAAKAKREGQGMLEKERVGAEREMRSEITSATKELDVEQRLKAIRQGREGLEAQPPTFSKTVSEGGESMTTRFGKGSAKAEPMGGLSADQVAEMRKAGWDEGTIRRAAERPQEPLVSGGPTRPTLRVGEPTKTKVPVTRIVDEGLGFASDKPTTWVVKGHLSDVDAAKLKDMYKGGKGRVIRDYVDHPVEFNASDEFGNLIGEVPTSSLTGNSPPATGASLYKQHEILSQSAQPHVQPEPTIETTPSEPILASSKSKMASGIPGLSENDWGTMVAYLKEHPEADIEELQKHLATERGTRRQFNQSGGRANFARKMETEKE